MVEPDERELVTRAKRGDAHAFGELVRLHQQAVFGVCYRLTGERREAEDVTQDAFMRAYDRLSLFDANKPFGPWMRRVAANVCLNALQKKMPALFMLDDERDGTDIADALQAPGEDGDPALIMDRRESAEALRRALIALPAHYRAVIELCHFQEMSYAEAAQALRLPLTDVKSHLFRARKALASRLRRLAPGEAMQ